jgi:diguanylate cyclase (GGDEF)-like protein
MPAWVLRRSNDWRFLRLLVLALLLVAGGGAAFHLSSLLKQHADSMTRYVRVDAWAVQQLEYEIHQFRARIAQYVARDEKVTIAKVRGSLKKVQATIPLLKQGRDYENFRLLIDIDGAADAVLRALGRVNRMLAKGDSLRGDLATLQLVEDALWVPTNRLRQLAIDLAHVRAELQDGDLENVRWLTGINRWMLAGFGFVLVIFIGSLISEILAARRAERAAAANERKTRYVAEHDQLTDLPNRIVFRRQLEQAIEHARRTGSGLALHILNLDGFKTINDTLGRTYGDALIVDTATRLRTALAVSDRLFRLGGDEFAVLQRMDIGSADWQTSAAALLATCEKPFSLDDREVHIASSVGIARFPGDANSGESLLKCADIALTEAKKERRCLMPFEPAMQAILEDQRQLTDDLRRALTGDELQVFYQAQVNLLDQRCIGAEALVRWRHPEKGWISPATFIPIAEKSGLILPLGRLVLEKACEAALSWQSPADTVVAVNVSSSQFIHQDIVEEVREVLASTGLPAWRLELEVTESLLMTDENAAISKLNCLHELGVRLAIDDFGTGYSSLNYLKHFKVNKLKIDQSFIQDLADDQDDQSIVRAVVDLGKALGLRVIAEGIEDREQLEILSRLGCDEGQGYLFEKPLPFDEFLDWLAQWNSDQRQADMRSLATQSYE